MQHNAAPPAMARVLLQAYQPIAWIWPLERQKQFWAVAAVAASSVAIQARLRAMVGSR
jgi:hypothetical protein